MLYLNTGVHFDEVVLSALVQQELASSGTAVIHCFGQLNGVIANRFSLRIGQAERRCELNNLLVSSLHGAISLIKVYQVAVLIAQHLNLDMLRLFQVFLDKNISVAECFYRFVMSTAELRNQLFAAANDSHSSSAAAGCRLQHYRITALLCKFQCFILGGDGLIYARNGWNANAFRYQLGLNLVTQCIHHLVSRSDEFDAALLAGFRETGILCQETITRVDGITALCLCQTDNFINIQVSIDWALSIADFVGFVCLGTEQRILVLFRIDCHGTDSQLTASSNNTNCNFTTVCYQNLFKLLNSSHFCFPH